MIGYKRHRNPGGLLLTAGGILILLTAVSTCKRFEPEQLVLVETGTASDVSYDMCTVSGEIYDAGSGGLDQHGFVWSLQNDPQLEGSLKSELGTRDNTGSFTGTLSGLTPNTSYYIRAYGTAGAETSYGKEIQVTSSAPEVPKVQTAQVTAVTNSAAVAGGEVTGDGGEEVRSRGVCWSTSSGPTLMDSITTDGAGTGVFTSQLGNLTFGSTYFLRAYATNSVGTAYGEEREFSTGPRTPELAKVSTGDVLSMTDSSAMCGGEVSDDGGSEITARGICWSTFQDPSVLDDTTWNGAGIGAFSSQLSSLECATTYFARAYVTNGVGTAYGEQKEFLSGACPVFLPTVITEKASGITDSSAISGGTVSDDGGAEVTARGVCWSTQSNPDLGDSYSVDGAGTGSFSSTISELDPETTYFYRAYATNSLGTAFGEEFDFTSLQRLGYITDIDGNSYPTVEIGGQTWMAENLKVSHFADGSPIPPVEDQTTWGALSKTDKAYCAYDYDNDNLENYGALYTWGAAMNGAASSEENPSGVQGVCPEGWHLPSEAEWLELEVFLGMTAEQADSLRWRGAGIGAMLKDNSDIFWKAPNLANNSTGFSALPGGHVNTAGYCSNKTIDSYFWSSTDWGGDGEVWYRHLWYDRTEVYRYTSYYPMEGYSVRCVKDE